MKLNLCGRALSDETREQRPAHDARRQMADADAYLADLAGGKLSDFPFGVAQNDSGFFRPPSQCDADWRQLNSSRCANKQLGANVSFQPLHASR